MAATIVARTEDNNIAPNWLYLAELTGLTKANQNLLNLYNQYLLVLTREEGA